MPRATNRRATAATTPAAHDSNGEGQSKELVEAQAKPIDRAAGKPLEIGGEKFLVGRLSLDQVVGIARVGAKALTNLDDDTRQELTELANDPDNTSMTANVQTILAVLGGGTANELFGVALERDGEWVKRNVDLLDAVDIIEAVVDYNDIDRLRAAFLRLSGRFASSMKPSD